MFQTRRLLSLLLFSLLLMSAVWLVSCAPPPPSLSSVVIAKGAKENNKEYEAIDPTRDFAAGTQEVHAILKVANPIKGTILRSVWTSIDNLGNPTDVSDKSYTFEEGYTIFSQDNYIQAENPLMGKYKLIVYLDGQIVQTAEFVVAKPPVSFVDAVTTEKVTNDGAGNAQAVNPTDNFPAGTAEIHTLVRVSYPENRTSVQIIWSMLDAQGAVTQTVKQDFIPSQPGLGLWTMDYTLTSAGGFAPGKYKVEIKLDGKIVHTFEVTIH